MDGIPLGAMTPVGMLCLVLALPYLQMARGKLVPRSTLEDAIHDRDETRTDNRIKDQQIAVKDEHIRELTEQNAILLNGIGPALSSFMDALQRAGKEEGTKT